MPLSWRTSPPTKVLCPCSCDITCSLMRSELSDLYISQLNQIMHPLHLYFSYMCLHATLMSRWCKLNKDPTSPTDRQHNYFPHWILQIGEMGIVSPECQSQRRRRPMQILVSYQQASRLMLQWSNISSFWPWWRRWLNFMCHCRSSQQQSFHIRNFVISLQNVTLCVGFNGLRRRAFLK